jgi:hypothetical protein
MNRNRYTERQMLGIVVAAATSGAVVASALFVASDRTAWPILLVRTGVCIARVWVTNR